MSISSNPTYLQKPYEELMRLIRKGKLSDEIEYKSADKNEFIELCKKRITHVVQIKYDGWWCAVTPEGLYTKNGLLRNPYIYTTGRTICIGEYIFGTQWADLHEKYKGKVMVYATNSHQGLFHGTKLLIPVVSFDPVFLTHNKCHYFHSMISDHEGYVLKDNISGEFVRWKKECTGDYVIRRCIPSTAKTLKGWACGAVEIGLYINGKLTTIGTAGGFNNELKADLFSHPVKYVGRVAQFTGKKIFKSGLLRHPAFERFREDKRPEDCTLKQFEGMI